jgi:prepilin-type N-terminal cleavage/methylation domain-containing protein
MATRRDVAGRDTRGFTLLELVVVLIVLALAAALTAPALTRAPEHRESGLATLLTVSREAAALRGETIRLSIAGSGSWRMEGVTSAREAPIQTGQVDSFPGLPVTLIVSPVGSCGFDARSAGSAAEIPLDPLTCTLRP